MGRTSELIKELNKGTYAVKPLSASSGQSRTAQLSQELRTGQYQVKNPDGTAARPAVPASSAAASKTETAAPKTKAKRESAGAAVNQAPVQRWENQLRQAQVDLDTDAIIRLNKQLKEERARQGKQTAGDRVSDVMSSIFSGSAAGYANAAGTVAEGVKTPGATLGPEARQRSVARLQASLDVGRTTDGKPLSQAQRKSIQEAISRLSGGTEPSGFAAKAYKAADTLQGDSARFQQQAKEGLGKVGSLVVDAGISTGQSLLDNALGAATGTGMLPFVVRSFGGAAQEARQSGADTSQQLAYGAGQAAKEFVTEKLFGLTGPQRLTGGGSLDDAIEKGIRNTTERLAKTPGGQKALGVLMTWLSGGATEGAEEVIGSVLENTLVNPFLRAFDPDGRTARQKFEDGLYDALVGAASGLMGGVTSLGYQVSPQIGARTTQNAAQEAAGTRLEAGKGTDTAQAQNAAREAQTGPENIFTRTAAAAKEEGDRKVRDTLEMMQRAAGMETAQKKAAPGTGTADRTLVQRIREAIPQTQNMAPVARLTGTEIPTGGKIVDRLASFVNSIGNKVNRPGFGDVLFSRGRIKSAMLGHGIGPAKVEVFAGVPEVIRSGIQIDFQPNWKGRGYDTYTFAAPINYRGNKTYLGVIVTKDVQNSRYYVHEVVDADGNLLFKNDDIPASASDGTSALSGDLDTVANAGISEKSPSDGRASLKGTVDTVETSGVEGTSSLNVDSTIPQGADSVKPGIMERELQRLFGGGKRLSPDTLTAVNENGLTALSQLERENLSSGKRNKVVSTFSEAVNFVKNALRNKQSTERAYLGKIPDSVAQMVKEQTGVDISGFGAILHSDNIRHIMKQHGDPMMEPLRGQIPLTAEYIAAVPEVLSNPDRVYLSPDTDSRGRIVLGFEKNIGGKYITMQAVSDGTHSIQTDTIFVRKEKNPQGTESYDAGSSTDPAHNARSVPPQGSSIDSTIPQGTDSVKPGGTDGLGAADAGFTTRGMEGKEQTSRMAESHPYNKAQEAATAMTREEYDRLFRYQSQTEAKTTHLAEELVYVLQDGKKTFLKDVDEAAYDALKESLQEATAWNAEQAEAAKMIELELLGRSYNSEITSEEYTDWLKTVREHGTSTGQGIQAFAKWIRADNNRGQATASQAVETIQNSKLSDAQKQARTRDVMDFTKRINDAQEGDTRQLEDIILEISKKRGTTTGPVAKRLDGVLRKAMDSLTFQELKQFAFSSTEALSTDTKPLDFGEAVKTIQVLNMLSSLKTPGRNLTGNTAFYGLDALSMDGAALLDMALANMTGTRSVAMGGSPINRTMWENAIKSAKMSTLETALDVDMGSGETMYGTGGQRTFRAGAQHEGKGGKALNFTERVLSALERNNSFLLTVPDEFFKGMARGNEANIQRLIDQGKIKTEDASYAAKQADELAKYRTFQDTNAASAISSGIHDLLNLIGKGDSGKKIKGLTVHSFGLGDFVSPFSRVAANLAARGVDYNPVTAVRGVVEMGTILYDAKRGKTIDPARQARAVSRTARGLSGTAVIGGFLALLAGGLIRRADDEGDENVAALNRSEGRTGYQFNLSAAKRWMDGESQKWQNGDKLLDISSLQPFNELLGVADQIYHDEEKSAKSLLIDDVLGMMYAAADIPVLQTAGDLAKDLTLYKKDPLEAFSEAAVNTAVSSVTPNILRSIAQGLDDRPRSINREDGLWRLIQDEFKSRTPGLRQTLPGGVDPTGEDKTYPGSRVGNFLNSTLNPMGLNTYEQTEQSQEWQRLREETGRTDFYPSSRIPKKLEGKGLSKDLSYEERQDFQRDRGIWLMLTVSEMMGNQGYKRAGSGQQSDLMKDARDFAQDAAKRSVLGPDSVSKWVNGALEAQQKTGLSPATVIYYRDMLSREKEAKKSGDANGTVRDAIFQDHSLTTKQKNALDDILVTDGFYIKQDKNVDYSDKDSFDVSQMSESAVKAWPTVHEGFPDMTGAQYGTAWGIYNGKGTKEDPYTKSEKKQDLREELDWTTQQVNQFWNLMVKAAERK